MQIPDEHGDAFATREPIVGEAMAREPLRSSSTLSVVEGTPEKTR